MSEVRQQKLHSDKVLGPDEFISFRWRVRNFSQQLSGAWSFWFFFDREKEQKKANRSPLPTTTESPFRPAGTFPLRGRSFECLQTGIIS